MESLEVPSPQTKGAGTSTWAGAASGRPHRNEMPLLEAMQLTFSQSRTRREQEQDRDTYQVDMGPLSDLLDLSARPSQPMSPKLVEERLSVSSDARPKPHRHRHEKPLLEAMGLASPEKGSPDHRLYQPTQSAQSQSASSRAAHSNKRADPRRNVPLLEAMGMVTATTSPPEEPSGRKMSKTMRDGSPATELTRLTAPGRPLEMSASPAGLHLRGCKTERQPTPASAQAYMDWCPYTGPAQLAK